MENTSLGIVLDKNSVTGIASRLTITSDPYHFVNTDVIDEKHPVDACFPWKGIEQRSENDNRRMYYVPPFWFKIIEKNEKAYFYISSTERKEFTKHPASGYAFSAESISLLETHMVQLLYAMEFLDFKKIG